MYFPIVIDTEIEFMHLKNTQWLGLYFLFSGIDYEDIILIKLLIY